jgi:hypothetical protein
MLQRSTIPMAATALAGALAFIACGDINHSWENDGGGYIKYQIEGSESYTIELGKKDVELTNYHRHYFHFKTRYEESDQGDVIEAMVYEPHLGENAIIEQYSGFSMNGSPNGIIYGDQSTMRFDQMDDSTWTADIDFYIQDCRKGICSDTLPRLHVTGRFRYWIGNDDD